MRLGFGHIGSSVSALVDGALEHDEAERAWFHVHTCPPCRRLVEREGWVKRQLSTIGADEPSARLLGSLYELDPVDDAWAAVGEIERRGRSGRRAGLALAGAGSVSAAVFGIASLGGAGLGIGGAPAGTPATSLSRSTATSSPSTAVIAPTATVHGRVRSSRGDTDEELNVGFLRRH